MRMLFLVVSVFFLLSSVASSIRNDNVNESDQNRHKRDLFNQIKMDNMTSECSIFRRAKAIRLLRQAETLYPNNAKAVAEYVTGEMVKEYGGLWHAIIGPPFVYTITEPFERCIDYVVPDVMRIIVYRTFKD